MPRPLTPDELQIIDLACQGYSPHDIAYRLGTENRTVRNAIARIRRSLGASSLDHAIQIHRTADQASTDQPADADRRPDASTISDDQLDQLYAELDQLREGLETAHVGWHTATRRSDSLRAQRDRYRAAWLNARHRAAGYQQRYQYERQLCRSADTRASAAIRAQLAVERTRDEARSQVAAARAFADEMAGYCSPHGVAADYAQRLRDRIAAAN